MSKHRLYRMENGVRWSQKASNNVLFSPLGELFRVDGTTVTFINRQVNVGEFWEDGE